MKIALIAHDKKKNKMIDLALKYKDVLDAHEIYATGITGTLVMGETGLKINRFKSGPLGGDQQIGSMIANSELDLVIFLSAKNEVAYMLWAEWFRACLHYMESPYRNDALFEVFVDKALSDRILDDYELDYFSEIKSLFGKNKPGSFPEELRLADRSGKEYSLSDFRGMETLLVFLDADCPSCLDMLRENASSPGSGDCLRLAVLVNGSPMHIDNISSRLPEEVLSEWTLLWCPDGMKEAARLYDLSYLPFRITLASDGRIVKSYH